MALVDLIKAHVLKAGYDLSELTRNPEAAMP
jgi:hypothetical protein